MGYYGPVHAWWTFPFERLIGLLQRIPTNFQNGKLLPQLLIAFPHWLVLQVSLKKPFPSLLLRLQISELFF